MIIHVPERGFYFNENIIIQHIPFSLPELRIQLNNHHQQSGELLSMLMMFPMLSYSQSRMRMSSHAYIIAMIESC